MRSLVSAGSSHSPALTHVTTARELMSATSFSFVSSPEDAGSPAGSGDELGVGDVLSPTSPKERTYSLPPRDSPSRRHHSRSYTPRKYVRTCVCWSRRLSAPRGACTRCELLQPAAAAAALEASR